MEHVGFCDLSRCSVTSSLCSQFCDTELCSELSVLLLLWEKALLLFYVLFYSFAEIVADIFDGMFSHIHPERLSTCRFKQLH